LNRHFSWLQFNERVEVMFHLKNDALRDQILRGVIGPYLADTEKTRVLLQDGTYARSRESDKRSQNGHRSSADRPNAGRSNTNRLNAQEFLLEFTEASNLIPPIPPLPSFLKLRLRGPAIKSTN
jgi:polyphosphate kinase